MAAAPQRGIVVFSGGTAANSIVDVFNDIAKKRQRPLSYVIPISDNGGSSSELIRVFGGPGIGDIRSKTPLPSIHRRDHIHLNQIRIVVPITRLAYTSTILYHHLTFQVASSASYPQATLIFVRSSITAFPLLPSSPFPPGKALCLEPPRSGFLCLHLNANLSGACSTTSI